uniref:Squalene cyclase N-terminal domain-containing protein n=1 Tax=Salix viminalis TaxID=40686 RepID=A0A6N2KFM4_SALVM
MAIRKYVAKLLPCSSDLVNEIGFCPEMWRLKIAAGGNPWLRTTNNHIGRQVWEFDPKQTPSPREIEEIENARQNFTENRTSKKLP